MYNKLLFEMGISKIPNCLFCKTERETIEHIYFECDNVKRTGLGLFMIPILKYQILKKSLEKITIVQLNNNKIT